MMFVSDIEIAAQVSYVKELLKNIQNCKVRTRNILLIWELKKESKFDEHAVLAIVDISLGDQE